MVGSYEPMIAKAPAGAGEGGGGKGGCSCLLSKASVHVLDRTERRTDYHFLTYPDTVTASRLQAYGKC